MNVKKRITTQRRQGGSMTLEERERQASRNAADQEQAEIDAAEAALKRAKDKRAARIEREEKAAAAKKKAAAAKKKTAEDATKTAAG